MFNFEPNPHYRFYGLGEKAMPVEKTGVRTKFYNTDLWADFPPAVYRDGTPDPLYCSIPYLLLDAGPAWIGILLSTPYPSFISLLAKDGIADSLHGPSPLTEWFSLGADGGLPELYLVVGEDPKTVTCRMQRLQGTVPLPPLWALGYHQSRWGYGSYTDLMHWTDSLGIGIFPAMPSGSISIIWMVFGSSRGMKRNLVIRRTRWKI